MNEEEKEAIEYLQEKYYYIDEYEEQRKIDIILDLVKNQKAEIKKKDKIIDLMAYDIATNDSNLCQYIDETIRCKKYAGENKLIVMSA